VKRREFISLIGGAAAAWPITARAQQSAMPVVGFLNSASADGYGPMAAAFRQGLKETGYIEGQNVTIEYRWAEHQLDRVPALAADLVRRHIALIVTNGPTAGPAKTATKTIPIVFVTGVDPIASGLVDSLSRPTGNATGLSLFSTELGTKRLELMREIVPSVSNFAVLLNPGSPRVEAETTSIKKEAGTLERRVLLVTARSEPELQVAFIKMVQEGAGALLISSDPFFTSHIDRLAALAAKYRLPASYSWREFATAGGLISYGTSVREVWRQSGIYAGRILKGAKPSELPVLQPSQFELVINLKTAKALGLEIPPMVLARADEVIE
jgi:putative tryptophan/tyrosine transport system substrate-binding protein